LQQPELEEPRRRSRSSKADLYTNIYRVVCLACTAIILTISSYGIVASVAGHIDIVGATLVNVEIPSTSLSPITAKPVSILVAAALGLTFSGLELARPAVMRFTKTRISILLGLTFVTGALVAYEVLYNFTIWAAELTLNSLLGSLNPDIIVNQFPNPNDPWNLVFATKITEVGFACAVYIFYYLITIMRAKDRESERELIEERQVKLPSSRDYIER
jgi:hypothetical protein